MFQKKNPSVKLPMVINKDGSLNIVRPAGHRRYINDLYHYCLSISWPKFFALVCATYITANLFFTVLYYACGPDALVGIHDGSDAARFWDCFFFSIQTLATIGYGRISPVSWPANILVSVEALCGMLGLAIITGVLYGRFSRPTARLIFSDKAIIGRYAGKPCFSFRVANARLNQLVEANMTVTCTKNVTSPEGETSRKLLPMELEGKYSPIFALSWTIRHFIDEKSPLHGMDLKAMEAAQMVIFASLNGMDETFSQTITARGVYRYDDIVYDRQFKDIIVFKDGKVHIDLKGIHDLKEP